MSTDQPRLFAKQAASPSDDIISRLLQENERLQLELNAEREKSDLFECIFRCIPNAIAVAHADRRIRMANPAFHELFGYRPDEVIGRTTAELYAREEDFETQGRARFYMTAKEQLVPYQVDYKTQQGRMFSGETIGTTLRNSDDDVIGYLGLIRDVTARERSSAELFEREQLLQLITDALPELVAYCDIDGVFRFVNATAECWYARSKSEIIGQRAVDLLGRDGSDFISPLIERVLGGETVRAHESITYPDKNTRIVELSYVPNVDPDGVVIGFVALVVDVTAHSNVAADLEISKQRLHDAIEAMPDAFAYYDQDDRLTIFNEQYRSFYAASSDLITEGAKFEDIIRGGVARGQYQEAVGNEAAWVEQRLAAHVNPGGAIEQKLDDGRWVRIEERKTRDGGIVGVRVDVTELKKREDELTQLAITDHLTGISNRRVFLSDLKKLDKRNRRSQGVLSVLIIDVDHFKNVNDTFGHAMGDEVLKQVARLIEGEVRPLDSVCRYGGEEFAVLLPDTSIGGAFAAAERIRRSVKDHSFASDGHNIPISVSIGATQSDHRDERYELALARADEALYQAKELGRNRVMIKLQ